MRDTIGSYITAGFVLIFCIAALIIILSRNYLDKMNFRLERTWKKNDDIFRQWANVAAEIAGLAPEAVDPGTMDTVRAFLNSKKGWEKSQYAQQLFDQTKGLKDYETEDSYLAELMAEKADFEFEAWDFVSYHNTMARHLNSRLDRKIGGFVGKLFRFKPYVRLNFVADEEK